jgi:hypothetical protein
MSRRGSLNLCECGFRVAKAYYSTFARGLKATEKAFSKEAAADGENLR